MLIWALLLLGLVGLIVIVIVLNPARSVAPAGPPVSIDLMVPPNVCRGEMVEISWTTEGGQAFFTLGTAELDPADERIIFSRLPVPAHYDSLRVEVMEDRLRFTIEVEASQRSFVVEAGEC